MIISAKISSATWHISEAVRNKGNDYLFSNKYD
jgi:hypothetical protein